jgi:hypothetical protein
MIGEVIDPLAWFIVAVSCMGPVTRFQVEVFLSNCDPDPGYELIPGFNSKEYATRVA